MEDKKRYKSVTDYDLLAVSIIIDRSYKKKVIDDNKRVIEATDYQITKFVEVIESKMGKNFMNCFQVFKLDIQPSGIRPMVYFPLFENGIKSNEMTHIFLKIINEWIDRLRETLDFNVAYGRLSDKDIVVQFEYQDILKIPKQLNNSDNNVQCILEGAILTETGIKGKGYIIGKLNKTGSVLIDNDLSYLDYAPLRNTLPSPDQLKEFSNKLSKVGSSYFNGLKVSLSIGYPYGLAYPTPFIKIPLTDNSLEENDTEKIDMLIFMLDNWMNQSKITGVVSAYNINQNVIDDTIFISLKCDDIIKNQNGVLVDKVKRDVHLINVITSAISKSYDTTGLYTIQSIPINISGVKHNIIQVDVDSKANGFTVEKRYNILQGLKDVIKSYLHDFDIRYYGLVEDPSVNPLIVILKSDDV